MKYALFVVPLIWCLFIRHKINISAATSRPLRRAGCVRLWLCAVSEPMLSRLCLLNLSKCHCQSKCQTANPRSGSVDAVASSSMITTECVRHEDG